MASFHTEVKGLKLNAIVIKLEHRHANVFLSLTKNKCIELGDG